MLLQAYHSGTSTSIAIHFAKEPTREAFAYLAKWCDFQSQTWEPTPKQPQPLLDETEGMR